MIPASRLLRFWTESWRAPARARWFYGALALGFAGLAIAGAVKGDATVIVLGALFALATAALAVFAPKLAPVVRSPGGDNKP